MHSVEIIDKITLLLIIIIYLIVNEAYHSRILKTD